MVTKSLYAIYGISGFGREVMPVARAMLLRRGDHASSELVFVDDNPEMDWVNGHRVLTYQQFLAAPPAEKRVNVAIADSSIREKLAARCRADGVVPFSVIASNAVVMDDVELGDGAIVQPFVTLTSNIVIGRHFHANIYSYVAHDCVIGDFVTFAPAVQCNGNVTVEDHVYVGTGAMLRQGKPDNPLVIGRGAIVGMGAVVTKDVAPGITVVGNPARPLLKS
jgi:sugar O-acyltransferase (sialic acid O-acetyltransferase NeuD family)